MGHALVEYVDLSDLPAGRHLLISSPGGHLVELDRWSELLGSPSDSLWVTARSPQTDYLLRNRRVLHVPYVAPRDAYAAVKVFVRVLERVDWRSESFTCAISTGGGLGVAGLAAARLHRIPGVFIETFARLNGPGLAGRLASIDPTIRTYCQWQRWSNRRWKYIGSTLGTYEPVPKASGSDSRPRLFVTLGTTHPYRFDAAIDAVLSTGLADASTVWQLGATKRPHLPGTVRYLMTGAEFEKAARAADVVITHAGAGSVITLFDLGIYPIVLPRRSSRHEHFDDHQTELADWLQARGIASVRDAGALSRRDVIAAASKAIRTLELGGPCHKHNL